MIFLAVLVVVSFNQFQMIDMELLFERNSDYNNNNYDYYYERLGIFKEDVTEYDNVNDQLIPLRFPSVDGTFSTIDEAQDNEDKRSIGAANNNLAISNGVEDLSRNKKSQVLCRVQKHIHTREEKGYDFLPKAYISYSCHRATPNDVIEASGKNSEHDFCYVSGNSCVEIEKEHWFAKRNRGKNNNCWVPFREAVAVGCQCLPQKIRL